MPSLEEFAYDFDRTVQARGREHFRRKAAKIVAADAVHIEGVVAGGNRYKVKVSWDEAGEPTYECSCPYFRDRGEPCKHLWATLLQADKDGMLSLAAEGDAEPFEGAGGEDEAEDDFEYTMPAPSHTVQRLASGGGTEETETRGYGTRRYRGEPPPEPKPADAGPDSWKRQLGKLRDDLRAAGVRVAFDDRVDTPFGRRAVDAELKGYPVRIEVGPRDLSAGNVVLVRRVDGAKTPTAAEKAVAAVLAALEADQQALYDEALRRREEHTEDVATLDNAIEAASAGWARLPWAKVGVDGEAKANGAGVTVRCLVRADGTVPDSEDEPDLVAYLARSY